MSFISNLEWRYATKEFDSQKKVSPDDLHQILESIRLAPTSFGLQAFRLKVIENKLENENKLKELKAAAWGQKQIDTCSHLLIFCSRTDLQEATNEYFTIASDGDAEKRKKLADYEEMVNSFLPKISAEWAKKQTYLALGFALAAAAELKIDSCPMEGFDPQEFAKIIELEDNLEISVILPIGYRAESENIRKKIRFTKEKLISIN